MVQPPRQNPTTLTVKLHILWSLIWIFIISRHIFSCLFSFIKSQMNVMENISWNQRVGLLAIRIIMRLLKSFVPATCYNSRNMFYFCQQCSGANLGLLPLRFDEIFAMSWLCIGPFVLNSGGDTDIAWESYKSCRM